jgi:hypothetical protein
MSEPKLSLLIALDSGNGAAAIARVEDADLLAKAAGQVIETHRRAEQTCAKLLARTPDREY